MSPPPSSTEGLSTSAPKERADARYLGYGGYEAHGLVPAAGYPASGPTGVCTAGCTLLADLSCTARGTTASGNPTRSPPENCGLEVPLSADLNPHDLSALNRSRSSLQVLVARTIIARSSLPTCS